MSTKENITDGIIALQATERVFYNYRHRPPKVSLCSNKPSKVQESPLDAKTPQELMDRHGMYVDRPALKDLKPFYADLSAFKSYEDNLNAVRDMKEKFNSLDISIRARFNHSPEEFCRYVTSKDFDIREIMTADVYKEYEEEQNQVKYQLEYEKYLKSDEYKKAQEESALRLQYEKEQYENWKKNFKTT